MVSRYITTLTITDHTMSSDAAAMHHAVMALFPRNLPSPNARQASGILYRLDNNILIIQSIPPPARPITGATINDTHHTNIEPPNGTLTVTIRLAAETNTNNGPTYIPKDARATTDHKPIPHKLRPSWAAERLAKHGFLLTQTPHLTNHELTFPHHQRPPIPTITITGTALITNPTTAHQAILNGIGRGKAYGCGLLTTTPN